MSIQTIEQKRAAFALKKLNTYQFTAEEKKEWLSRANEIPAMIQMNGIGQTLAFYIQKGGTHKKVYELLSEWLCNNDHGVYPKDGHDLMYHLVTGTRHQYQVAQAETQALLKWVKKFSRAFYKSFGDENG
ncbi:type III-B CRISPR module-associated protein Cmr5 [Pelistega sp. MC2]|uniref:type III-B CRISPR module-associated protein Cmr5 n=1 Tax=Pelistega sp. MC2 TaxID=1720297 RepID=UPI0008DA12D3|nr:type III-B CRISPR module-associated protein Cmr5 [Pelistega sp. MC2]